MHELSVAMSIIDAVEEEAQRHPGRVQAIHLKLGPLSGVVAEALRSAFELAREGTTLADSSLVIQEIPIVVYCPKCEAPRPVDSMQWFVCSACGTPAADVVQGKELELISLEMTDGE